MKEDDTWTEGLIGMQTDFVYFIPQSHKIRKGGGFVLRLPEQGSGVEGAHKPYAVLLHKGAVLLGHGEIGADHPLGGDAAQADHDLWLQQLELFPEPGHTGLALGGQRVTVVGRAALDDVGNIAVFAPVQIDGKQVAKIMFFNGLSRTARNGNVDYLPNPYIEENLAFSFVIGYFFGVFTIDVVYSAHLVTRIRQFATENEVDIKLEQLKAHIRRRQDERREKANFLFAFRSSHSLAEHLREAQEAWEERHKAEKK